MVERGGLGRLLSWVGLTSGPPGTDMPTSQPIDIPDAKKRGKKKKRCRATDSFSGKFEGEWSRLGWGLWEDGLAQGGSHPHRRVFLVHTAVPPPQDDCLITYARFHSVRKAVPSTRSQKPQLGHRVSFCAQRLSVLPQRIVSSPLPGSPVWTTPIYSPAVSSLRRV